MKSWNPPHHWMKITTIDAHTEGEPFRLITAGFPEPIGSRFSGRVVKETQFGPYTAIIPEVEGTDHITGHHEFFIDPDEPLKEGFILR